MKQEKSTAKQNSATCKQQRQRLQRTQGNFAGNPNHHGRNQERFPVV